MKPIRTSRTISDVLAHRPTPRFLSTTTRSTPRLTSSPRAQPPSLRPTFSPTTCRHASSSGGDAPEKAGLSKTPLYDLHLAHGGKMVGFGGFHMPVQYSSLSVAASHHFTRSASSLFDVSHMVQHHFSGPGATAFLQTVAPIGLAAVETHGSSLSCLLHRSTGGIVDDCIITRLGPELFYVVTNAGCREKDLAYLREELDVFRQNGGAKVEWGVLDGWGLVALQGPKSEEVVAAVLEKPDEVKVKELYFGQSKFVTVNLKDGKVSSPVLVSRGGYTGEDGFEISIQPDETVAVTEALLARGEDIVQLAGLGARDSLRLEAGMCLYGHDLDDSTTPVEAALSWIIGKDRKTEGGFHGAERILAQLKPKSKGGAGVERRRIGLIVEGAPAREGVEVVDAEGKKIGNVTSGCPSPSLGKNIAMAYIQDGYHKAGTDVDVLIRGKKRKAVVTKMPFVPSKYYKTGTAPA